MQTLLAGPRAAHALVSPADANGAPSDQIGALRLHAVMSDVDAAADDTFAPRGLGQPPRCTRVMRPPARPASMDEARNEF